MLFTKTYFDCGTMQFGTSLDRFVKMTPLFDKNRLARIFSKTVLAGGLALSLAGCLGYDGTIVHGYQPDQKSLEQVRVGASAEQVLVLLGTPSTTSTVGGDAWYYVSQQTERSVQFMDPKIVDQHIYAVYFDKAKKVQRIANYGLEDGKVIDHVTRTTPTGGAEATFLRGMFTNLFRFS